MNNYLFELLDERLTRIENLLLEVRDKTVLKANRPKPHLIKINEAVQLTGYSKQYLYDLIHKEAIPFYKRGRAIRFDPQALNKWMRSKQIKTNK